MFFYLVVMPLIILAVYYDDIQVYLYNRKTPEQKYIAFRKARADYNHKNGIVDEFQYDYMHGFDPENYR